jgi:hypothetical protein
MRVLVLALISGLAACGSTANKETAIRVLPCRESIGSDAPSPGMTIVLGVVALPASTHRRRALQTALTGSKDPAHRLFAKEGLVIRTGARFELIVPARLRSQLAIGWGNADEDHVGSTISVAGCHGTPGARWLDFAGGYLVPRTTCAPLIVEARGQRRRVRIGIGRVCPGQLPPPQPTQT